MTREDTETVPVTMEGTESHEKSGPGDEAEELEESLPSNNSLTDCAARLAVACKGPRTLQSTSMHRGSTTHHCDGLEALEGVVSVVRGRREVRHCPHGYPINT